MFDWLNGHIKEEKPRKPGQIGGVNSDEARKLIVSGRAEPGLHTSDLHLYGADGVLPLPEQFSARSLAISDCAQPIRLSEELFVNSLTFTNCSGKIELQPSIWSETLKFDNCPGLESLPDDLKLVLASISNCAGFDLFPVKFHARNLEIVNCSVHGFADKVVVEETLELRNLPNLVRLPSMSLKTLIIRDCPGLKYLPDRLEVEELDLSGSTGFQWQESELVLVHRLNLSDCTQITHLPYWVWVEESIDVANTELTGLPKSWHIVSCCGAEY